MRHCSLCLSSSYSASSGSKCLCKQKLLNCLQLQSNLPGRLQVQSTAALRMLPKTQIHLELSFKEVQFNFSCITGKRRKASHQRDDFSFLTLIENEKLGPMLLLLLDCFLSSRIFHSVHTAMNCDSSGSTCGPCVKYCQIKVQHLFTQQRGIPYKARNFNPTASLPICSRQIEGKRLLSLHQIFELWEDL